MGRKWTWREKLAAWRLERRVRKGKQPWGRKPGSVQIDMPGEAAISARVFRTDTGQWEDLGIIAKTPGYKE